MPDKGETYEQGVYLGERINEAGLIVDVYEKNGTESEIPLSDAEQVVRRTPVEPV